MNIAHVYRPAVDTCSPDDRLQEAARRMAKSDTGVLAVVAGDTSVGVISERDVVRAVAQGADLRVASVGSHATTPEMAASLEDDTTVVARQMLAAGVRRLPVVGEAGKVVGMVSMRDLFSFEAAA